MEKTLVKWRNQIDREARQEGRQEGRLEGMRKVLLRQMTLRFGRLPEGVRLQVEQITSVQELNKLTRTILAAKSP